MKLQQGLRLQGPVCHEKAKLLGSHVHLHGSSHSSKLTLRSIAVVKGCCITTKTAAPAWQRRAVCKMHLYLRDTDGSRV